MICARGGADHPVVYVNAAFEHLSGYPAAELPAATCACCRAPTASRKAVQQCKRRARPRRELPRAAAQLPQGRLAVLERDAARAGARRRRRADALRRLPPRRRRARAHGHARRPRACRPGCARTGSRACSRAPISRSCCAHDWDVASAKNALLTLLMFDIDALAAYNDTFGRAAGDACIRRIAGVMAARSAAAPTWSRAGTAARSARWCAIPTWWRPRSLRSPCAARAGAAHPSSAFHASQLRLCQRLHRFAQSRPRPQARDADPGRYQGPEPGADRTAGSRDRCRRCGLSRRLTRACGPGAGPCRFAPHPSSASHRSACQQAPLSLPESRCR